MYDGTQRPSGRAVHGAQSIRPEQARAESTIEPLLTPLLESDRRTFSDEQRRIESRLLAKAGLEGILPAMVSEAEHSSFYNQPSIMQPPPPSEEVLEVRRRAAQLREAEILALESKLQEAIGQRQRHGTADTEARAAEIVEEEAVSSVVQHLTPFGLNRNLPWQIYATRQKRFVKPSAGTAPPTASGYASGYTTAESDPMVQQMAQMHQMPMPEGGLAGGYAGFEAAYADSAALRNGRTLLRSVYDQPARPARRSHSPVRRRPRSYEHGALLPDGLPPVKGAEPWSGTGGAARLAWSSPRGGPGHALRAARAESPRAMRAPGSYY